MFLQCLTKLQTNFVEVMKLFQIVRKQNTAASFNSTGMNFLTNINTTSFNSNLCIFQLSKGNDILQEQEHKNAIVNKCYDLCAKCVKFHSV